MFQYSSFSKENVNNFFIFFTGFTYLLFFYHSLVIHFYSWTAEYSSIVYIDVLETQVSMFIDFYSYFSLCQDKDQNGVLSEHVLHSLMR